MSPSTQSLCDRQLRRSSKQRAGVLTFRHERCTFIARRKQPGVIPKAEGTRNADWFGCKSELSAFGFGGQIALPAASSRYGRTENDARSPAVDHGFQRRFRLRQSPVWTSVTARGHTSG